MFKAIRTCCVKRHINGTTVSMYENAICHDAIKHWYMLQKSNSPCCISALVHAVLQYWSMLYAAWTNVHAALQHRCNAC
jgi:hypothetical protein